MLETGKEYLVESRVDPLAQKEGFNSLRDFLARLQGAPFNASHQKLIHAMTTNETLFFRDIRLFQLLRTRLIPDQWQRTQPIAVSPSGVRPVPPGRNPIA